MAKKALQMDNRKVGMKDRNFAHEPKSSYTNFFLVCTSLVMLQHT